MKTKIILALSLLSSVLAISQENSNLQKDNNINKCECTYPTLKKTTFSPDLASLTTYNDFRRSGFEFVNGKKGFEGLFIKNVDPSNLTIWKNGKIPNLVYKRNVFSLNLTPCTSDQNYYEVYTQSKVFGDNQKSEFDVTIQIPSIQIELSEKIIRRWSFDTKTALKENGAFLKSPILITSAKNNGIRLDFSRAKSFSRFENTTVCMNETEISNTNVGIELGSVFLFDLAFKDDYSSNYLDPQVRNYLDKLKLGWIHTWEVSGVFSAATKINLPLETFNVKSNGNGRVILNNNFVLGNIELNCFRTENNNEILLPINEKENKRYSIETLTELILKLGFEKVNIEIDNNKLNVYFMKFAEKK